MLNVQLLRTLEVDAGSGPRPLGAASGLVRTGSRLHVVADDEHFLGCFDLADRRPGTFRHLFDGELPAAPGARKAAKPDLEALAALPPFPGHPHGALLALGSGSRPQRQRAALLAFDGTGTMPGAPTVIDLSPLYAPLHALHPQLNIEGAFVDGDRFCLLQRGNGTHPVNVLIGFDWALTHTWLRGLGPAPEVLSTTRYELGERNGVPLCFTDGAALPGGGWVFCAAAEATADNYADGTCEGSAVGVVGADGRLRSLLPLSLACKAEGIAVTVDGRQVHLLMVTDADDPGTAAMLLAATLERPGP